MTNPDAALRRSLVRPEREQHGTVLLEAATDAPGVSVARVQPTLERMARRGQISRRQMLAGERIYRAWALGIVGARDGEASGNGSDPSGYTDRRLDAATEYRRLRDAIGMRPWICVFHVCCEDWSLERFANDVGKSMDRKAWAGVLKLALSTAADHLGLPGDD